MTTFARYADGVEPLEVSGQFQKAEIIEIADRAWFHNTSADRAIKIALKVTDDEGDPAEVMAAMKSATRHDALCKDARSELARRLSRAGYKGGTKVECGNVVVLVCDLMRPVTLLGRVVPSFPAEPLETEFDTDHSDRDELAERTFEYHGMVRID